jgi:hypothetical protein
MESVQTITPNGPTITVFKGWRNPSRKLPGRALQYSGVVAPRNQSIEITLDSETQAMPKKLTKTHFKFVNSSTPDRSKDADVRKLVRTC